MTFEKLVKEILEKGRQGIKTTLNFGDSSTSGWNSDICTDNAIKTARLLYADMKVTHPELPDTFEAYCLAEDAEEYRSRNFVKAMAAAAEKLKSFSGYRESVAKQWTQIREEIQSPFLSYDTYSEKGAKIDPLSHVVNLGVPGFSSVHLKSYIKRMLQRFKHAGVQEYIHAATIYIGNNDCVHNGNQEDKYVLGEDTSSQLHGVGYLKEKFPRVFFTPRVSQEDYRENLEAIIGTLKSYGINQIVLTVPVVPLEWRPGLRSASDAQKVIDDAYEGNRDSKASRRYETARDLYDDFVATRTSKTEDRAELFTRGQAALESDPMVPRIKSDYVKTISEVALAHEVAIVNLSAVLPIRDMSHQNTSAKNWENITIDYCHPAEHVNILIAYAQSLAKNSVNPTAIRALAKQELLALGFGMNELLAESELSRIEQVCVVKAGESVEAYRRLSVTTRSKIDWKSS